MSRLSFSLVCLLLVVTSRPIAAQTAIEWLNDQTGNWSEAAKWSDVNGMDVVPDGPDFDVTLNAANQDYTVTIDQDYTVNKIFITNDSISSSNHATIQHVSGTLSATEIEVNRGFFELRGGTIKDATINSQVVSGSNGRFTVLGSQQSTLDNVSVDRTIFVGNSSTSGNLRIVDGLDLLATNGGLNFQQRAGTVILENGGTISGVLEGTRRSQISFGADSTATATLKSSNGTLIIGENVWVRTSGRGHHTLGDPNELLINRGRIALTRTLESLDVTGNFWRNEGLLSTENSGTLNLKGTYRTGELGVWRTSSGRIQILGDLHNTGSVLDFSNFSDANYSEYGSTLGGAFSLKQNGRVIGGTIMAPNSSDPFFTNPGNTSKSYLDGVNLDGFTRVSIGEVEISNGLTLQNTLTGNSRVEFNTSFTGTPPKFTFSGTQSLAGQGEVVFNSVATGEIRISGASGPSTLTVGDGITITTGTRNGIVGSPGHNLINQGTLRAARFAGAARTLFLEANQLTNEGLISVTGGSTVDVTADQFVNSGSIDVLSGTLSSNVSIENKGTISGSGSIDAAIINTGTLSPGTSPGLMTIASLNSSGTLLFELEGTTRGTQYDAIDVTGDLTLSGTIDVDLISGFTPAEGNTFDLLNWNTASFGAITFDFADATLSSGLQWDTSSFQTDGTLSITAVPEPSSVFACLVGAGIICLRNRRGRKAKCESGP